MLVSCLFVEDFNVLGATCVRFFFKMLSIWTEKKLNGSIGSNERFFKEPKVVLHDISSNNSPPSSEDLHLSS